jgi:hypothetical protein
MLVSYRYMLNVSMLYRFVMVKSRQLNLFCFSFLIVIVIYIAISHLSSIVRD